MDSPIRCEKKTSTSSTLHSRSEVRNEDPALSPVFHSLFDAETVVLSPSSVSNLSLQSDVPTIVFGVDPVASPVRHEPSGGCAVGKAIKWYAICRSIHGRSLIVNHWMDCEPHVKVWNVGKTEKIIPYGVQYKSFDTFEEAAIFLFVE